MNGKESCSVRRYIRKEVAKANGIKYTPTPCPCSDTCNGTCDATRADDAAILNALQERVNRGEPLMRGMFSTKDLFGEIEIKKQEPVQTVPIEEPKPQPVEREESRSIGPEQEKPTVVDINEVQIRLSKETVAQRMERIKRIHALLMEGEEVGLDYMG